jgi:hypothetical protein
MTVWTAAKLGEVLVEWADSETCEGCPLWAVCVADSGTICRDFAAVLEAANAEAQP